MIAEAGEVVGDFMKRYPGTFGYRRIEIREGELV
jgi:hypothetical protein